MARSFVYVNSCQGGHSAFVTPGIFPIKKKVRMDGVDGFFFLEGRGWRFAIYRVGKGGIVVVVL